MPSRSAAAKLPKAYEEDTRANVRPLPPPEHFISLENAQPSPIMLGFQKGWRRFIGFLKLSLVLAVLAVPLPRAHAHNDYEHDRPLTPDSHVQLDLGLDSLQIMNFLLLVEDHYDISIPVSILSDVKTVKDLAVQIEKLTGRD